MLNHDVTKPDGNVNTSFHGDEGKVNTSQLSSRSTIRPDDVKADDNGRVVNKPETEVGLAKRDSPDFCSLPAEPSPLFGGSKDDGCGWGAFDSTPAPQNGGFGQYEDKPVKFTSNHDNGGFGGSSGYGGEQTYKKPKQDFGGRVDYEVFVSGLSFDATDDDVRQHFSQCGNITSVKLLNRDGRPSGKGFIKFGDEGSMTKALSLNDSEMMGRSIKVELPANKRANQAPNPNSRPSNGFGGSNPRPSNGEESSSVIVRNLSYKLTEDELGRLFEDCGSVKKFRIIKNESGQSKGFGFVDFDTPAEARNAIGKTGTSVHGRSITVDFSMPKEGKQGGGGRPNPKGDYGDKQQGGFGSDFGSGFGGGAGW